MGIMDRIVGFLAGKAPPQPVRIALPEPEIAFAQPATSVGAIEETKFDIAALRLPDEPVRRERVPHYPVEEKAIVTAARGVDYLIHFINKQAKPGYYTGKEIDQAWNLTCIMNDLEPIAPCKVREAMRARKMKVGRPRMGEPQFAEVRRRNPKIERPVLYKIPAARTESGQTGLKGDESVDLVASSKSGKATAGFSPVGGHDKAGPSPHNVQQEAA